MILKSTAEASDDIGAVIDIERVSDLEKILRVTAFVVRFESNLK